MKDLPDLDVLIKLESHSDALKLLVKLSPAELDGLAAIMRWPTPVLAILRDHPSALRVLYNAWELLDDKAAFLRAYASVAALPHADSVNILDAFSQGQLASKAWLLDTVRSHDLRLGNTWILCGWIGTLAYLMLLRKNELGVTAVRSFDIDDRCADLADTLNRSAVKDRWMFKSFTQDVNMLDYDSFEWSVWSNINNRMSYPITDSADTIINTSCDHMGSDRTWWDNIQQNKLIILQNNNWFENEQHNNSVNDLDEFKRMYPMKELLFAGQLDCTLYTRFMLIGRK